MIRWYRKQYREFKDQWWGVPEVFERQDVIEVSIVIWRVFAL